MGCPGGRPLASDHCNIEVSSLAEGTFILPVEIFCAVFVCLNDYIAVLPYPSRIQTSISPASRLSQAK